MPRNNNRARNISVLSITAVAVMALAACGAGGITKTSASSPSTVVTTSPSESTSTSDVTTSGAPSLAGQLTSPRDGSKVDYQQEVRGVVTGLPPGTDAWIVVYPNSAPAYWPQLGPLSLDSAGRFRTSAYIGASVAQGSGETFVVYLVIASTAASERFRAFLGPPDPNQGMSALPSGVKILESITVTRR